MKVKTNRSTAVALDQKNYGVLQFPRQTEDVERITEKRQLQTMLERERQDKLTALAYAAKVKEDCRKEINGMAAFIALFSFLAVVSVCFITAPWWTAIAPILLALGVIKKAEW